MEELELVLLKINKLREKMGELYNEIYTLESTVTNLLVKIGDDGK